VSADDTRFLYYLTPHGWVQQQSKTYGNPKYVTEKPADAIETWEEHLTQPSIYSETLSSTKLIWFNPEYLEDERKKVRNQFPEPFEGYAPAPLAAFRRGRKSTTKPKPADTASLFDEEK
jgi:hypothetical protein